tara:strand:- start:588 stop:833 length:246 start_codon:yes stop_codon:yes gene_type:complete
MKTKINNQIKLFEESIDWWREESLKTSTEVEKLQELFDSGEITEHEVMDEIEILKNKMDYLSRKGLFEQRNLFEIFASRIK